MSKNLWKSDPEWFERWFDQPEYHILYGHRSQKEAIDFVRMVMNRSLLGDGVLRILDVGCGAGRHAAAMSSYGHDVVGMDLSQNNITSARSLHMTQAGKIDFVQGDMRKLEDYFPSDSFDAITMLFTSFGYFQTDQEHVETLRRIRQILKDRGTFILDFLNLEHVTAHLTPSECVTKEGIVFQIHRRVANGWIEKSIEFVDAAGVAKHHVERVKAFSPSQLHEMLKQAGFYSQSQFGNYNLQPLGKSSHRCIIVAH
ncbi:MAG: hypothetical protein CL834_07505 [Crocinitomicaceae bacterium]|nr:hypothetical protein [Crocinitomicaceae bacterium]|tara:strand:+ start:1239 stop:2006 length:768 start_codon:yes stop_codon:yes gene_type:complete